jgi:2-keto-4-pentenoate hydratase
MLEQEREAVAADLLGAYAASTTISPIVQTNPNADLVDAYRIQMLQVEHWVASGRKIAGHKVGLTSVQVQKQLGVDQPDFGHLFADMFHLSGDSIPVGTYLQPKVEPEISFILKKDLVGPDVTISDAILAIDYVIASLEIVDSRIAEWKISLVDTVSDNASSGGVVLGTKPMKIDDVDLRTLGAVLYKNGRIEHTGAGAAVLGSPVSSLVWLANTLGRLGTKLEAGSLVMPGAITPMIAAQPGDTITAEFNGLGSVTARFAH